MIVQTDLMDQPVKVTMTIYRIDLLSTIQARLIYEQYYSVCWYKDFVNLLVFTDIQMQSKRRHLLTVNCSNNLRMNFK